MRQKLIDGVNALIAPRCYGAARRHLPLPVVALVCASLVSCVQVAAQSVAEVNPTEVEFFETHVRPLLVSRCLECHGSDAQEGGLRLDIQDGWKQGGTSGAAIVPGKPEESLLIRAISYLEKDLKMPPDRQLSVSEIAVLRDWIQRGAHDPRTGPQTVQKAPLDDWQQTFTDRLDWWSLKPMTRSSPPAVNDTLWPRDAIDSFILAGLEAAKLQPAPPAEPEILLRRLSLVLTGLPATLEKQDEFLRQWNEHPQFALTTLVDGLLSSPHFGEHMGRHWLDVVRYTDTYGYEWDNPAKGSWEYRDYVTRVFNQDVPYDQFVREQLAGDLLSDSRINYEEGINESLIGPMFYHMGEHRHGSSLAFNGVHQEMINNKIEAMSKAFLATTVACARCHNHKLEAVSQKDYYALAAVLMTPRWTSRSIDIPERHGQSLQRLKQIRSQIREELSRVWANALKETERFSPDRLRAIVEAAGAKASAIDQIEYPLLRLLANGADVPAVWDSLVAEWNAVRTQRAESMKAFQVLYDSSGPQLPDGWVIDGDGMKHGFVTDGTPLISLEGPAIVSRLLPGGYHTHALSSRLSGAIRMPPQHLVAGRFVSVQMAAGEFGGYLIKHANAFQGEEVVFVNSLKPVWKSFDDTPLINGIPQVTVDFATSSLNSNFPPRTGLAPGLPHTDLGYDKRSWISITGIATHDGAAVPQSPLNEFASLYSRQRPSNSDEAAVVIADWLRDAVRRWTADQMNPGDTEIADWLLTQKLLPNDITTDSTLQQLVSEYREIEQAMPFSRSVNSMDEREIVKLGYPVNIRGNVDVLGEVVRPDFLQMFAGKNEVAGSAGSGRLELANSLLQPDHPLTTRVYVNRIWQWIFGTGLVSTPDDFGRLGDRPSHPELLDYLAGEFQSNGWSSKQLIRRLVLSQTFLQSGAVTDSARERDPDNRLLHHYPTRRLEAESIRDSILAVSGRLDPSLYGRPIDPPRAAEDSQKRLFSGPADGHGRRSLYLKMSIMEPPRFLVGFNLPDPKLPTGRRDSTNVPVQALQLLNDPFTLSMAEFWARRLLTNTQQSVDDRIRQMFREAWCRDPDAEELTRWQSALRDLSSAPVDNTEPGLILQDQHAWTQLAHAIFNSKEFIYYR